jgi:hypothetical protein
VPGGCVDLPRPVVLRSISGPNPFRALTNGAGAFLPGAGTFAPLSDTQTRALLLSTQHHPLIDHDIFILPPISITGSPTLSPFYSLFSLLSINTCW